MSTYPRCKFHPDLEQPRTVRSAEEEALLGEGWYETPADFPERVPEPIEAVPAEGCPNCEALVAKFSAAYGEMKAENAELERENLVMRTELKKAAKRGKL